MAFQETELVLFTADLAGSTRACAQMTPLEVAGFLGDWYRSIDAVIGKHGGRVVKYMGDGCLATFPPDGGAGAVAAAMELREHRAAGQELGVGVRIHVGTVAEGEVGADRRYDIFGSAVNDLFRMGSAGSVLISEPVYQRLPDEARGAWQRAASSANYAPAH
jgi:adenylate cyclase